MLHLIKDRAKPIAPKRQRKTYNIFGSINDYIVNEDNKAHELQKQQQFDSELKPSKEAADRRHEDDGQDGMDD